MFTQLRLVAGPGILGEVVRRLGVFEVSTHARYHVVFRRRVYPRQTGGSGRLFGEREMGIVQLGPDRLPSCEGVFGFQSEPRASALRRIKLLVRAATLRARSRERGGQTHGVAAG
jgi:hypothetical protein